MSGRKQHYIPQFLLNGFSEPGKGKYPQVRVITRENTFLTSTEGVAAQREFYSKLGEPEGSLDDLITGAEGEYSDIYRTLVSLPPHGQAPSDDVGRLLAHLTVRGGHIRDTMSIMTQYAAIRAAETVADPTYMKVHLGIDLAEPNEHMRKLIDELYNEHKSELSKQRKSRHEFRREAFATVKQRWGELTPSIGPTVRGIVAGLDAKTAVATGHRKMLTKNIEPPVRAESLARMEWFVRELDAPTLVLPDSIAIAHYKDVGAAPLGFVGNDEIDAAFFPLTPTRALCAGAYAVPALIDTLAQGFFKFAATVSWNFVVQPPSFPHQIEDGAMIGVTVTRMIAKVIEDAVGESVLGS